MLRFTQASRLLRLHTPLGDDVLLAESLHGEEGIGEGFRFQVTALSTDASLPLKGLLGQAVLLELEAPTGARPFHGHVTACELCGADGGFARYLLVIEPWTAFLKLGRDSRVFQDQSIIDIVDAVFANWGGKGALTPAWRFEVDRSLYPLRSLTTQYQESDFAFVTRLLSEEGLFGYFEHSAGAHTFVIADSNDAFQPNPQPLVRFTQPGATMRADSVDRWRTEARLGTNAIDLRSWDYRSRDTRDVSAGGGDDLELRSSDTPGAYAYTSREHGARIAERQLQALEAGRQVHTGAGTVRSFAPGTTFTLLEHANFGATDSSFLIVRVRHQAHNNLDAEVDHPILPAHNPLARLAATLLADSLHATGKRIAERPAYRNSFEAIPSTVPYRASSTDGHGQLLHPRPTIHGQQTAIVVGPPGAPVHTDRDHRIKVQFHWQRGAASHSRLDHPQPEGHVGAPGDAQAGTWVRVATPLAPVAGANWGSHALPRVGQEVLIDFIDGNIDRPVVIGAVYNGRGAVDQQNNQVAQGAGPATGNASAWFPGASGGHAHPAALAGIKSQALAASAQGAGAYSQLVFDDSPNEARLALQHHADPHTGTDELNLGHLRHQTDNQRLAPAGFGAELKTEQSLAVRAGSGLLLTGDAAPAHASALDVRAAAMQVEQSQALHQQLAETAQKHNARLENEPDPDKQPAIAALAHTMDALASRDDRGDGDDGGTGSATAFSEAHLQVASAAGIVAVTPASAIVSAGATTSMAANQDLNFAAQGSAFHAVKGGISLFTYGKASQDTKPNQETGIRLHAASGSVSSQSQSGPTLVTASKAVAVTSVEQSVNVAAREHVLLAAQGASIRIAGGDIELIAPGKVSFRASMKELAGGAAASPVLPALPHPGNVADAIELHFRYDDLEPVPNAAYVVTFSNGTVRKGHLDGSGHARLDNVPTGDYTVEFGEDPRAWHPPAEPVPDYKKPELRELSRQEIERERAEYERRQA